jgi:hypothetical protein
LAGRPAEELVDAGQERGKTVRVFDAETLLTKPSSFAEPQIHVDMRMGGQIPGGEYIDPSFSEAEGLKIWDTVISSIRRRPGAT